MNDPSKKVELPNSRLEPLKLDALCTTKGVKEFLAVAIQTALIGYMDRKLLPCGCLVRHLLILCVIGHKPLQITQRNTILMC